jgi:hypothetical protein
MKRSLLIAVALAILGISPVFGATGFLRGQVVSGLNKACYYDVLGSPYTVNIGATQLCPITIEAPNPAPNPSMPHPLPQQRTGFLKGERTSGMNKICFYDILGQMYTLTISAVGICPISQQS